MLHLRYAVRQAERYQSTSSLLLGLAPPLYPPAGGYRAQPSPIIATCLKSPAIRARAGDVMWRLAQATGTPGVSPRLHAQQAGSRSCLRLGLLALEGGPKGMALPETKTPPAPPSPRLVRQTRVERIASTPWPRPRASQVTLGVIKGKVLTCRPKDIT